MQLGFKVDDAALAALDKRLDGLIAKAKGVTDAFKDAGLVVSGGGGGSARGGSGARSVAAGGVQDRTHVDLWRWNQRNEAEKKKEADKLVAQKKHAFTQQLHWMRRLTEVSTKVAVGLGAVNASFLAVAEFGRRSAVNLTQFGLNTGISPQTLQRFQQVVRCGTLAVAHNAGMRPAVRVTAVAGPELATALRARGLPKARRGRQRLRLRHRVHEVVAELAHVECHFFPLRL